MYLFKTMVLTLLTLPLFILLAADPVSARDYSSPKSNTKVVMLGSGSPVPIIERFGPGVAVVVNDRPYLIDAGEGIWRATRGSGSERVKTYGFDVFVSPRP